MTKSDTSHEIQRVYDQKILELSGEERFLRGMELTRLSREMCRQGLSDQYPSLNEQNKKRHFFERVYGSDFSEIEKRRIHLLLDVSST